MTKVALQNKEISLGQNSQGILTIFTTPYQTSNPIQTQTKPPICRPSTPVTQSMHQHPVLTARVTWQAPQREALHPLPKQVPTPSVSPASTPPQIKKEPTRVEHKMKPSLTSATLTHRWQFMSKRLGQMKLLVNNTNPYPYYTWWGECLYYLYNTFQTP